MENLSYCCSYEGCQKSYSNSFNLKRHIESFHMNIKKFFCDICHKGLSSKQNMREHSFIHQDTKPYVCRYEGCQEAFRQLSQQKLHENIHRELEKYKTRLRSNIVLDLSLFNKGLSAVQINEPFDSVPKGFQVPRLDILKKKFEFETEF